MIIREELIQEIMKIILQAGDAVLAVYNDDYSVEYKEDRSPVTEADRMSDEIIRRRLENLQKNIPIVSEESEQPPTKERQQWEEFWLVDPLDGTREFMKRNGEFTVNIALVRKEENDSVWLPVFGIVYAPIMDEAYLGWIYGDSHNTDVLPGQAYKIMNMRNTHAYWRENAQRLVPLRRMDRVNLPLHIVRSRSHRNEETSTFIRKLKNTMGEVKIMQRGSCLKMCEVASGAAHAYPRFFPTMEWDTAAAHAVCRAVGVSVIDTEHCRTLTYNKDELRNPGILVTGIRQIEEFLCGHIS